LIVPDLRRLQHDFQHYLLAPDERMDAHVVGTERASAAVRLDIYAQAYRLRLLEALATDFPALQALLGAAEFETAARRYIEAYPSRHFSLRWYGDRLAEFLRGTAPYCDRPALSEMAAFEWAMSDAFDAENSPVVTVAQMAAVPPPAWPEMRFAPHASLRRLDLRWNVPSLWNAADKKKELGPEQQAEHPIAWIIWRQELKTYFRSLAVDEACTLDALLAGRDFASLCAGLCEWIDEANAPAHAAGMLKRWINDGLIAKIDHR
jgi:hypothetical protein